MDTIVQQYMTHYGVDRTVQDFLSEPLTMYIKGERCLSSTGGHILSLEASTGGVLAHVPEGSVDDVDRAVQAAREALSGAWAEIKATEREKMLLKLADLIERDAQLLAQIESLDNGKAVGPCVDIDILGGAD